jgi:hypothetical protein
MDTFSYIKISLWLVLILGILAVVALLIHQLTKAGSSVTDVINRTMNRIFGPDEVVMPKNLKHFVEEAVNQPGGYIPWTPKIEEDEVYPPPWLTK